MGTKQLDRAGRDSGQGSVTAATPMKVRGAISGRRRSRHISRHYPRVTLAMWGVLALFAAVEAYISRGVIDSDGVSYLELGHAWAHLHLAQAINAYWSPLYSVVLGAATAVGPVASQNQFAVVHAVNLTIFLLSLPAFAFLMDGLLDLRVSRGAATSTEHSVIGSLLVLSYCAFGWASLSLITVSFASPDLLVALIGYVAAGLLVRFVRTAPGRGELVAFGTVLGLGYLAKSAMLLLALGYFGGAVVVLRRPRRRLLIALAAWVAICVPWAVALSLHEGRLTTGDSGTLNYAWYVEHVPNPIWIGSTPAYGQPTHPPQVLSRAPFAVAFTRHLDGSQPLWSDPSYWYDGVRTDVNASMVAHAVRKNAVVYIKTALQPAAIVLVCALGFILFLGDRQRPRRWVIRRASVIAVPALGTLLLYLPVTATTRYVGGAVAMLAGLAVLLPTPTSKVAGRVAVAALGATALFLLSQFMVTPRWPVTLTSNAAAFKQAAQQATGTSATESGLWDVAVGLHRLGVGSGARVATLGDVQSGVAADFSNVTSVMSERSPWALLGGFRIVADVTSPAEYWALPPAKRTQLLDRVRATGASVLVAEGQSAGTGMAQWRRIGTTPYYMLRLPRP